MEVKSVVNVEDITNDDQYEQEVGEKQGEENDGWIYMTSRKGKRECVINRIKGNKFDE